VSYCAQTIQLAGCRVLVLFGPFLGLLGLVPGCWVNTPNLDCILHQAYDPSSILGPLAARQGLQHLNKVTFRPLLGQLWADSWRQPCVLAMQV